MFKLKTLVFIIILLCYILFTVISKAFRRGFLKHLRNNRDVFSEVVFYWCRIAIEICRLKKK